MNSQVYEDEIEFKTESSQKTQKEEQLIFQKNR